MTFNNFNLKIKKIFGDNFKVMLVKILFPLRNLFCLFNIFDKAEKKHVNVNYWKESSNLGDSLAPLIVNYMLNNKKIQPDKIVEKTLHLYTVGSVLTAGIQDCTVWGSGILNAKLSYRLKNRVLDVRAVRGPFTRAILMDYGFVVPEIYGDPAIILPEIYTPRLKSQTTKIGLILHKDYDISKIEDGFDTDCDIVKLNICTENYREFIDIISSMKMVISSSLHGIIIAEVYGIPAVLLKPQVDTLKYYDYYYGTGRLNFPVVSTLAEAKKVKPAYIPDFSEMRKTLKKTFPYDLYQ